MFRKLAATTAMVLAVTSTSAFAASLTITGISGEWKNIVPGSGISTPDADSMRWGTPSPDVNGPQSGYDFDPAATSFTVADENTLFDLGTFTHLNNPITGTTLTSADLEVTISLSGVLDPITTTYSFLHNETPNLPSSANPDPSETCTEGNGLANATGLNINGCADVVTATLNEALSETFTIGSTEYFLDITGFKVGTEVFSSFFTVERQDNVATLQASFRTAETPNVVPLPAAGWMLLAGIGGLAAMRRRKEKAAA